MRVTRKRREFGFDVSYIDKDPSDQYQDYKATRLPHMFKKKVLEVGLQAANKMKVRDSDILTFPGIQFLDLLQQND